MITFEEEKMCPGMGKMMKIVVLGYGMVKEILLS